MVVNYRWLKYLIGGLAIVLLIYLEVIASGWTDVNNVHIRSTPQQHSWDKLDFNLETTHPSSSMDTEDVSTSTTDLPVITTTHPVDPNTLRYMHRPGFLIDNSGLCGGNGSQLLVLILVTSATEHLRHRMAIRYTWGHFSTRKDIAIAFMLGAVDNETHQQAVQEEADMYGDVIQSQDMDSYRRLPLKTLSLLQWVDEYCPGVKFILKTDDDMFINVPQLVNFVHNHQDVRNTIFGLLARGWRPNRSGKYKVTREEYLGSTLPDFTTGPGYLITGDIVRPMFLAALDQRFLPLEDVLFTGLVAGRLGIKKVHSDKFQPGIGNLHKDDCRRRDIISVHDVKYEQQFVYWSRLLDGTLKC